MKGVTENYGDRNKEINEYIRKNRLDSNFCIALDDEKDIVEKVVCKYFITNFASGMTEKDIPKIISLFVKKKRFF